MLLAFKIDINKIESFIAPFAIIIGAIIVGKLLSFLIRRYIRKSSQILKVDPTNYSFLQSAVSLIVFLGAVFFVIWNIPQLHDLGKTLFAGSAILAAIIGFASQEAFSNIISGIFIVIYKPFSVGDQIRLLSSGQLGEVEDITLRHTILKSMENRRIVIPNSVISREQILNSNIVDERIHVFLVVVVTYESNYKRAMEIMKEEALAHPLYIDARTFKEKAEAADPVPVQVISLESPGIQLRGLVWTRNTHDAWQLKCDLHEKLVDRFRAEKIEFARDAKLIPKS